VSESSGLVLSSVKAGSIGSARAAAFARCDLGGDHAPWDRLAASQLPGPRRGPDNDAEPAATDIPAVDADVDSPVITGQLPQVLVMHDASDGSQVGSCSSKPPRGDQYLRRVRTLTTTWARAALDDHRGGQAVVRRVGSLRASSPSG
jgi:hypothetical protein